jgi:hypothetical protein
MALAVAVAASAAAFSLAAAPAAHAWERPQYQHWNASGDWWSLPANPGWFTGPVAEPSVPPVPAPPIGSTPVQPATPGTATAPATGATPLPSGLAGHPLVHQFSAQTISSSPWNQPPNAPGSCPANPGAVSLSSAGNAQLATTGQAGNCTSIQSPQQLPTSPGYVYEIKFSASSFDDWPSVWAYGTQWPQQGEVDAVEANFGANYASFHSAACNSQTSSSVLSTDPWAYDCKTTADPVGANITAGGWNTVDIAFTGTGVSIYYDGHLYVSLSEALTPAGNDPMWLTVSDGSCSAGGANVCADGASSGPPGTMDVAYIDEFS